MSNVIPFAPPVYRDLTDDEIAERLRCEFEEQLAAERGWHRGHFEHFGHPANGVAAADAMEQEWRGYFETNMAKWIERERRDGKGRVRVWPRPCIKR
jgi:hypothetical protein